MFAGRSAQSAQRSAAMRSRSGFFRWVWRAGHSVGSDIPAWLMRLQDVTALPAVKSAAYTSIILA